MKQMRAVKSFCSPADGTVKKGAEFYAGDARAAELKKAGLAEVIDDLGGGEQAAAQSDVAGGKRKA